MKKLIFFFLFINVKLVAYNQVIKGTIFDNETRNPIYSAAVYFNGTSVGTLSDEEGNFRLDISSHMELPGKAKWQASASEICFRMNIQSTKSSLQWIRSEIQRPGIHCIKLFCLTVRYFWSCSAKMIEFSFT